MSTKFFSTKKAGNSKSPRRPLKLAIVSLAAVMAIGGAGFGGYKLIQSTQGRYDVMASQPSASRGPAQSFPDSTPAGRPSNHVNPYTWPTESAKKSNLSKTGKSDSKKKISKTSKKGSGKHYAKHAKKKSGKHYANHSKKKQDKHFAKHSKKNGKLHLAKHKKSKSVKGKHLASQK